MLVVSIVVEGVSECCLTAAAFVDGETVVEFTFAGFVDEWKICFLREAELVVINVEVGD